MWKTFFSHKSYTLQELFKNKHTETHHRAHDYLWKIKYIPKTLNAKYVDLLNLKRQSFFFFF